MLRHVDGFDHCHFGGASRKYANFTNFLQGAITPGRHTAPATGGGFAFNPYYTAGDQFCFSRVLDAQNRWIWGFDFRPYVVPGNAIFWRWESGPTSPSGPTRGQNGDTVLAVKLNPSGRLEFLKGGVGTSAGLGTSIVSPANVFNITDYKFVEFDVTFHPTAGQIKMYLEGSLAFNAVSLALPGAPDRFSLRWESGGVFGYEIDNLYVADAQGPAPYNAPLGPIRISPLFPSAEHFVEWSPLTGLSRLAMIDEGPADPSEVPDLDATYNAAAAAGAKDLFAMEGAAGCYARILAIAANVCARQTAGSPTIEPLCRPTLSNPVDFIVGDSAIALPVPADYRTVQGIAQASLKTPGSVWNDRQVRAAAWGYALGTAGGDARVTQVYLEKVCTLAGVPFGCGQNSYSF